MNVGKGVVRILDISLMRIDDRLIHGQVMTAWVKYTNANRIVIIDDEVVKDAFMVKVLKMAAPPGIRVEVFGAEEGSDVLKGPPTPDKVIVLMKNPKTALALWEKGVTMGELNVGGMGAGPGRKPLYRNISASAEETAIFNKLAQGGVAISFRIVPDDKAVPFQKLKG